MSVLVAFIREAQPGRVAEVRAALQDHATEATRQHQAITTYQVLQGRAQSNLYVDLIEWEGRDGFEQARQGLRATATNIGHLFLRPATVRVYRPLEVVRMQHREPAAVGVGLVRTRPGLEDYFAALLKKRVDTDYPKHAGLLAVGIYQAEDESQHFLVRTGWDSEENLVAYRNWVMREMFPASETAVARRELLSLLTRWYYRDTPLEQAALT